MCVCVCVYTGIQNHINFDIQSQWIKDNCEYHLFYITPTDVDKSIKCLRKSKSDGTDKELKSGVIIHSTCILLANM